MDSMNEITPLYSVLDKLFEPSKAKTRSKGATEKGKDCVKNNCGNNLKSKLPPGHKQSL